MLVTDDALVRGRDLVTLARAAELGGVTSVQLRLKAASAAELASLGRALLRALGIPVIINDRLDVALAIGAHGVHLGPDDMPVAMARRISPAGFIIGASVGMESERENGTMADYWGIGPWSDTTTKHDAGSALGAEGFRRIATLAGARPCIAIGGIQPHDVGVALAAGAAGVAVVSGILAVDDVASAARRYRAP
jgi:thiamine-phosphate pyrophosphorylase